MPDINPAALSSGAVLSATMSLTKPLTSATLPGPKAPKTQSMAQRIDLEPLYTALKSAVGEHWSEYKETITFFVLGQLNQQELVERVGYFIVGDANKEHLHNQLVSAIYGNVTRELPDQGVAPWVSANDKPANVGKPASGDAAEQRLKQEVMSLPARDRRRIKDAINRQERDDAGKNTLNQYYVAKQVHVPEIDPNADGGLSKTNWELEIKKRYNQQLASEINEFPDNDSIQDRMIPICYEEGIPNGAAEGIANFISLATEFFVKQTLTNVFTRLRTDGPGYAQTKKYKRQLLREKELLEHGKLQRDKVTSLLPVEQAVLESRKAVNMSDFRMTLIPGDMALASTPAGFGRIMNTYLHVDEMQVVEGLSVPAAQIEELDVDEDELDADGDFNMMNGYHDNEVNSDDSWAWEGGNAGDRKVLGELLDECLAFG